jgi:hypothetical protein
MRKAASFRRSILFAAALTAMSLLCPATQAAGISVFTDSGTLGAFTLTNAGIAPNGVATLSLKLLSPTAETLETVNGALVMLPAAFTSPITLAVTPLGFGAYSIAGATYTKTFGTGAASAMLTANLTGGATAFANFFNLEGHVTAVGANALPGYTFAPFAAGTGIDNVTLTATNFTGGASSFGTVISTVGASATGSGAFSEAVPEPVSLAFLGIGLSGLLTFRRFFKRASVA